VNYKNNMNSGISDIIDIHTIRIEPTKGWLSIKFRELWEYRELLYFFLWRDFKVRYKQTVLGVGWAIIQPLVSMVIFTIIFGRLAKIPSDGIPYPIFSYTALIPWSLFAQGLSIGSQSMVDNSNLIKKVYFPRLIIPMAGVLTGITNFILSFIILLLMMPYFGIVPTINVLWLPLFLLLTLGTSLGVSLWLSVLHVQFRDIGSLIPFLTQIWFFITPVVYPSSLLQEPWRTIYGLNPMVGVVEGFRWALLSTDTAPGSVVFVSSLMVLLLLIGGILFFRRMEKTFADVL
jgi:lipopolysaccharide transport system permease protein